MKKTFTFLASVSMAILLTGLGSSFNQVNAQTNTVAFWHFEGYDFEAEILAADAADLPAKISLGADVDNTVGGTAVLEAFLGNAGNFDDNGGGGFVGYTTLDGDPFAETRTIRWQDSAGGGGDFFIGTDTNNTVFNVDENDGAGVQMNQDFGNDALIYLSLDGTGFEDFQLRFDLEGTPDDPTLPDEQILPTEFDIFYRTTGPGGTFFRTDDLNNVELNVFPIDPANPDNQRLATDQYVALVPDLDNASSIEIIINSFNGNDELELDNLEIVANVATSIPEPSSTSLIALSLIGVACRRRR